MIISQIIFKVINDVDVFENTSHKVVIVKATDFENVQILEMIDFHLNHFNKEKKEFLNDFTNAYIQKHRLFRESSEDDLEEEKPLTAEEKRSIWRMSNITSCMSNVTYQKKLEA